MIYKGNYFNISISNPRGKVYKLKKIYFIILLINEYIGKIINKKLLKNIEQVNY